MKAKQEILDEIQDELLKKSIVIRENKEIPTEEKIDKIDVILNLYKIIRDYDKNIAILQKHLLEEER